MFSCSHDPPGYQLDQLPRFLAHFLGRVRRICKGLSRKEKRVLRKNRVLTRLALLQLNESKAHHRSQTDLFLKSSLVLMVKLENVFHVCLICRVSQSVRHWFCHLLRISQTQRCRHDKWSQTGSFEGKKWSTKLGLWVGFRNCICLDNEPHSSLSHLLLGNEMGKKRASVKQLFAFYWRHTVTGLRIATLIGTISNELSLSFLSSGIPGSGKSSWWTWLWSWLACSSKAGSAGAQDQANGLLLGGGLGHLDARHRHHHRNSGLFPSTVLGFGTTDDKLGHTECGVSECNVITVITWSLSLPFVISYCRLWWIKLLQFFVYFCWLCSKHKHEVVYVE